MEAGRARDLILRCVTARDQETWREFQERFDRPLVLGVYRTLRRFDAQISEDERQDLLQETYYRLLEGDGRRLRRCRGQAEGAIAAYLGRVAENVAVDFLRSRSAAKRGGSVLVDLRHSGGSDPVDRVRDPRNSPEERLLLRERRARFLARCEKLVGRRSPERDLQVLYLAFFQGWTSREICGRVGHGLKPGTVDSLIHRVKKRLQNLGMDIPRRRPQRSSEARIDGRCEPSDLGR